MEEHVDRKLHVDSNILDLFWRLGNKDTTIRVNTCADILSAVIKKQQKVEHELCQDLKYCIERLVKGLASSRNAARLGYGLLLTEILIKITNVQIEEILELMKEHLTFTSKQDKRDVVFGQLFGYTAIIRSKRLQNHPCLSHVVLSLYDLFQGKNYIVNATYEIILDLFSQLSSENFKQSVWPQLKSKLPDNWENCSADTLWVLLLCIRLFPDAISSKYLRKHWTNEDLLSIVNLIYIRKIIKQTSSTFPMLHPLCSEFLLLAKQRKDFNELWIAVVDDNLFDGDQSDFKSVIGFEMVKSALQEPHEKNVKVVLSQQFRAVFSKAFLNTKHPLNPAANHLAEFLCTFAKNTSVPDMQIIILKTFLQPPGKLLMDEVLKKKEVSLIMQHLLPDAVKAFSDILKEVVLKSKASSGDEKVNNMKQTQAVIQLGNLVAHPVMLTDMEWRMDIIKFLFLHSFFTVKETTSDIPHCEKLYDPLSDSLRDACMNTFYKAVHSLHMRSENNQSPLETFLQQVLLLTEYADILMNATENVDPNFPVEKIQLSWNHLKTIVHKLNKQSKKDGLVNESNAFQALFLQLGFLLFQDPVHTPEILEELYICCKEALKDRKHQPKIVADYGDEPPWIGVVIDILLSLLSKSSKHLRSLVTYVFPLFCPFIDDNALQQILDVINPQETEDMLVDESDEEGEADRDVEFGSGSSSDESEGEQHANQPVDEEFKKKILQALGPAADYSDTESVVLSDSEMFKLDDALSQVFKSRTKSGHTLLASEEKTLLNFRIRCFDLIMAYLKSEPPMHLVLMCLEPTLAAFEFGHHGKHQTPLLRKAVSVLQFMTKMKKFQHNNEVSKSELKRLLDALIPKCHKEIDISTALKLYSLCIFIVLCYRKLENTDSPDKKKSSKTPSYIKTYLSNLDTFVSSGSSNMLPQFFSNFMEACPDLSSHFIEPCKNYAFSSNVRLFKRTQCLGLLSEALKYSKSQKDVTDDQWLEFGEKVLPLAIESLKNALDNSEIKPVYITELLNIIFTSHLIIKEKLKKSLLEKYVDLIPLLTETGRKKLFRNTRATSLRNKIIQCLGGNIKCLKLAAISMNDTGRKSEQEKRKSEEVENCENLVNGDEPTKSKKKKLKHKKKNAKLDIAIDVNGNSSVIGFSDS